MHTTYALLAYLCQTAVASYISNIDNDAQSSSTWKTLNGRSYFADSPTQNLTERATSQCGPSYGNTVCDAGQCCSPDGKCGTGGYYCDAPACLFQYGPACDANKTPPGTNTSSLSRPQFGKVPYGVNIRSCTVPGKVALTFDDGPYLYTSEVLDVLKSNNVNATFFVVGNNGGKGQIEDDSTIYPKIIKRMISEGHQIASHTWSHQDLSTLSPQQITDQVVKNEIALADVLGFFPTYLRPPYASCNEACLSTLGSLGYHVVNYDVDTSDWKEDYPNSRKIFSSAISSGNPKSNSYLTLAHDIHKPTVTEFTQYMIDTLKSGGYSTALVGECLADPPENWYRDAKTGKSTGSDGSASAASNSASSASSASRASSSATSSSAKSSTSNSSSASSTSSTATSRASAGLAVVGSSTLSSSIRSTSGPAASATENMKATASPSSAVPTSGAHVSHAPLKAISGVAAVIMAGLLAL